MAVATKHHVLSDDILARCAERAPVYDRENRFFTEDFEELRRADYLRMNVPEELGGMGMNLAQVCQEQRRLAYHAAPTALAVNMHLYWTGVAADLWRAGDKSLEWLLKGAVAGEVFAAGHAETGNDLPLLYSSTKAERIDGGYRFTGHKSFGSLPPYGPISASMAWTSDPQAPVVHAFMPRDTKGYQRHLGCWACAPQR
jgi:alkylation response protein AidB-like acyl-CoA dehydrogenase